MANMALQILPARTLKRSPLHPVPDNEEEFLPWFMVRLLNWLTSAEFPLPAAL